MNVHLSFYGTHLLGPDPFTGELDLRFKPAASGASQLTLTCPLGGFAVDGKGPGCVPHVPSSTRSSEGKTSLICVVLLAGHLKLAAVLVADLACHLALLQFSFL